MIIKSTLPSRVIIIVFLFYSSLVILQTVGYCLTIIVNIYNILLMLKNSMILFINEKIIIILCMTENVKKKKPFSCILIQ